MAFGGPVDEGQVPMGGAPELHINLEDGVCFILERPAGDGCPEVIRIVDSDEEGDLPVYISSDEEEEGEVVLYVAGGAEDIPPLSSDDEQEDEDLHDEEYGPEDPYYAEEAPEDRHDEEEEDEETEDEEDDDSTFVEDWSSEDSGYDTMYEDEEDFEDDGDDIRPRSPLIQQLQPLEFWHGWRQVYAPDPARPPLAGPFGGPEELIVRAPLEFPEQQVEPPEQASPSVLQSWEECAPSTSGLGSSTKRSREDSDTEQVSVKRQRWNCEDSDEEPAPCTSGHGSSTSRTRGENYRDSAPSTSGLSRGFFLRLFEHLPEDSDSD